LPNAIVCIGCAGETCWRREWARLAAGLIAAILNGLGGGSRSARPAAVELLSPSDSHPTAPPPPGAQPPSAYKDLSDAANRICNDHSGQRWAGAELTMLRDLAKALISLTPYTISRNPRNRFDAMGDFLRHLVSIGYRPRLIVDGGAHLGWFARQARACFPEADIHMVEPQPACASALRNLCEKPGFYFHPLALTSERKSIRMVCDSGPDTGAHVAAAVDPRANVDVQGETLDNLLGARVGDTDRVFIKLDLQGHEIEALRGAKVLLPHVEIVLTEFSFFTQLDEATVPEIVRFFDERGFDLFDIVSVSQRNRDGRARSGDMVFVRRGTPLWADRSWA
jgi:FkbM family methyltransferase